jgi:hypothetical protein
MNHLLHKQVYSGLFEIVKDRKYYYHSPIGKDYCHLTDEGKVAVAKWLELMAPEMQELEQQQLDAHAKKLMWEELKK